MVTKQHSEQWLETAIAQIKRLQVEAAECGEDYVAPTEAAVNSAAKLMRELRKAEKPGITVTQDGEVILTWEHEGDHFKAIVRCTGDVVSYQNKKSVAHDVFAHRLLAVPA